MKLSVLLDNIKSIKIRKVRERTSGKSLTLDMETKAG